MEHFCLIYSDKAAKEFGSNYYLTADGKMIEVTAAIRHPDWRSSYKWADAECVYEGFAEWAHVGRKGSNVLVMRFMQ